MTIASAARHEKILTGLKKIINELTGVEPDAIDAHTTYFEMGVSSLLLIQANRAIEEQFGVQIALAQFFDELKTLDMMAAYLDQKMAPEELPMDVSQSEHAPEGLTHIAVEDVTPQLSYVQPKSVAPVLRMAQGTPATSSTNNSSLQHIVAQQLGIMSQQLGLLQRMRLPMTDIVGSDGEEIFRSEMLPQPAAGANGNERASARIATNTVAMQNDKSEEAYVPFEQTKVAPAAELTAKQQQHIKDLIARYTKRTRHSKELTQQYRSVLADPRTSAGFRPLWKEMLYPLVVQRSQGSRLWDVDGNEYVDLTMGFGVHLFGHSPEFIREALTEQLSEGIQLGPQSYLTGEVAELISELAGVERVTFCNSGTEAVMSALRVARSVTGRARVAFFSGSYHGTFDGILARSGMREGERRAMPMAPGVMPGMIEDVLVLEYGSEESLDVIRKMKHELAAVLVEPVQSRRPDFQPEAYLQEIRRITEEGGAALIFDEVVTGFRMHPGGCQALFNVRADLVTYGKVVGGGMPIGVIAGKAAYMDAIDGGTWRFGDASYPTASKTFFSGTFCKHPLAMIAARAALRHLKAEGPQLQERLNESALVLATTLNNYFTREGLEWHVSRFGSLLSISLPRTLKYGELFSYHLVAKGVYVWEGSTRYLSTAHTKEDIDYIERAVKESVEELRDGGFIASDNHAEQNALHPTRRSPDENNNGNGAKSSLVPLGEGQKQIWLMAQLGTNASHAYNESNALRLRGHLNVEALRRAIQKVIARYESLRTNFSPDGDYQIIHPHRVVDVPFVDLSSLAQSERESRLAALIEEEAARNFDLTSDALVRFLIVKLEKEAALLVLNFHHIIMDGWSSGVLISDLEAFYGAECRNVECTLPPPKSFRDGTEPDAAERQSLVQAAAETYWLDQFADSPPALELPTDHPYPLLKSYKGAHEKDAFDESLCRGLKLLAAQHGCTLNMTVLACYQLLIQKLTGQHDIVTGVFAAGQLHPDGQAYFGHFVNMLPLRCRVNGDPSFKDYLSGVRKMLLDGFAHQQFSFIGLVKKLNLPRDPSRSPLFSAAFNFGQAGSGATRKFYDLDADVVTNETHSSKFDIYLNVTEKNGQLLLDFEYNTDILERRTIQRWIKYLHNIMLAVISQPERRLSAISPLSDDEREQILFGWNETSTAFPRNVCVHELFETQVERTPHQLAVSCADEHLSYAELNSRANQLAHYLRSLGVGPETVVGVCLERTVLLPVALLGVLKAGGAYLPLDPSYPPERMEWIYGNAGVQVVLTDEYLEAARNEIAQQSRTDSRSEISSEHLAYLIYTSGSTGRPKGVQVTHGNLVNFLLSMQTEPGLSASDTLLAVTTLAFDIAGLELYLPLITGGRLVLASREQAMDGQQLLELLRRSEASVMQATPATWRLLLDALGVADAAVTAAGPQRPLKVLCGGEALPGSLAADLRQICKAPIYNLYGPTETTIWSALHEVNAADVETPIVSLGRPIANTQLYVLDDALQPVPVGARGEIYIGGNGVARGYFNDPCKTAEKFMPNPFSRRGGERFYRTGDLGRYREDGDIEFLGRRDTQVKIRGFRIELQEIEAALTSHPDVKEAVVIVRENQNRNKRLVAYVVNAEGAAQSSTGTSDLLSHLRGWLPQYMIPTAFVTLSEMPLTPNGKVDRSALPAPDSQAADRSYAAPRTPEEKVLVDIWANALGQMRVGIHDNFFELGGDSILAIQIVSKARQAGQQLTPSHLFLHQTIAELATVARPGNGMRAEQAPVTGPVSLTPIQHWFFELDYPARHHFNQSVLLEVKEAIDRSLAKQVVQEWIKHHDALRLRFVKEPTGWRQFNAPPDDTTPFEWIDLSELSEGDQRAAIEMHARRVQESLNLSVGPLVRVAFFHLGPGDPLRLLIVIHHLVVDGVSWRVLLEDLQTVWEQLRGGEAVQLPAKTTSFQYWSERLVALAQSEELPEEMKYWLALPWDEHRSLPLDFQDGRNTEASASTISVRLSVEETRALLQEVPAAYHTEINDALLTALVLSFRRWVDSPALLIDLEGHGREDLFDDVDLSRTVGWFTSIFPVFLKLDEERDVGEALTSVKEQLRSIPRRGLGYGLLRYLSSDTATTRALGALPLSEVNFNYLGQFDQVFPASSPFKMAAENTGPERDPQGGRSHLLEITGLIAGEQLRMNWTFSENIHRRETIEELAQVFLSELQALIVHCQSSEAGGYTPSDFADFGWSQSELNSITTIISESAEQG